MTFNTVNHPVERHFLNPGLYALDAESSAFFKSATGIHDDDQLKKHILRVQTQAYAVRAQGKSTLNFYFQAAPSMSHILARFKISKAPAYKDVLRLGQERKGALLLDIGCCFGNNARKAASDGFPAKQIIGSDLKREFWDLGHVLFCSDPTSFPVTFVAGDVLDPAFLSPFTNEVESPTAFNLSNLSTLNDLRGRVSAIWATSFFHIFSEKDQRQLARSLGSLLSTESGSVIFGTHIALLNKSVLTGRIADKEVTMFCHDPDSWEEVWVGQSRADDAAVFPRDSVKLDTMLRPVKSETGEEFWSLVWSIKRV